MIRLLLFCGFVFCLQTTFATDPASVSMEISSPNGYSRSIHNYDKFSFYDSLGNQHKGKIYILNDSQFCFVDYFLERRGDIYSIQDIYALNNYKTSFEGRRTIPLGVKILGAMLIPYFGAAYLLGSEIYRHKKRKPSGGFSRIYRKELEIKIKGFAVEL